MAAAETVFRGATAIVTGGASGIGRRFSERLGKLGANVTVVDMQTDLAESVAAGIKAAGGKAQAATLDVPISLPPRRFTKCRRRGPASLDFVVQQRRHLDDGQCRCLLAR